VPEKQRRGFVDLHTYRYQGHSMSDPQKYRTKEEVEGVKKKDSIDQLALYCMNERKSLTEEQFIGMQREVKETVAQAMKFAEDSPIPDASELYTDVYANPMPNLSPTREYGHGARNPLL
jgi:pyruvate dehydrogenase E1 component alpha subunit